MSQPARLRSLRLAVAHYSICPSVQEITIVFNGGPAPNVSEDFKSAVPIRLRAQSAVSLSNRFRPDQLLKTPAVLQMDDDVLVWCSDVERAFAEWRRHPHAIVGFFPRLILAQGYPKNNTSRSGVAPQVQYYGEEEVFAHGEFNAVLTKMAFLDRGLMEAYWSEEYERARSVVDRLFNCEDILMNFVAARRAGPGEVAARYVRPRRRLDVSGLTGVGLSRNGSAHLDKRQRCTAEFMALLNSTGAVPLPTARIDWRGQPAGRSLCWVPGLGCIYL